MTKKFQQGGYVKKNKTLEEVFNGLPEERRKLVHARADELAEEVKLKMARRLAVPEFDDMLKVLEMGAKKYGDYNWLQPNGQKSSFEDMHMSMVRHLTKSYLGIREDDESGLDHLLHLACRSLMMYTLLKRGTRDNKEGDPMPYIEQVIKLGEDLT